MSNIFWKSKDNTVSLEEKPFRSEDEFEDYLFKNNLILGDIFILWRQLRSGTGKERPDIIGVDNQNNIVLIELKNEPVKEDVIPQVLRYAIWAETNPDSIRANWLECKDKPDDVNIQFDNLSLKILIVAPSIDRSVLRFINKIKYPIELVEVNRYQSKGEEFILVHPLEPEPERKITTTRPEGEYDRKFYEENYNKTSVATFFKIIEKIDNLVAEQKWDLKKKFNKGYVGYKYGFFNVFGINWIGSKSIGIFFKVTEETHTTIKIPNIQPLRYEKQWSQSIYKIDSDDYPVETLLPLFNAALKNFTGQ